MGSSTVTLATLSALISQSQEQQKNTGGGNIGTGNEAVLKVGPGLSGGGPLLGTVLLNLTAPIPWGLDDGGGGGDGDAGPPGQRGVNGANGATGGVGPTGPAIFMAADEGQDGDSGPMGPAGAIGLTGATGPAGTTLVYVNTTVPAGNTVSNTSSETFFTSAYSLPAGSMTIGMVIRVKLFGIYSTGVVAPSLALKLYFGTVVMIASGTLTTVAGVTNDGWSAEGLFIVQTIGVAGTIEAQGLSEFSTASTAVLFVNMDNTTPVVVDTTIAENIRASVQWGGTVNASDTITLREMTVEILSTAGIPAAPPPIPFTVFFGEDGEDGLIGPPGVAGAPGTGGTQATNLIPEFHTSTPTFVANDDFEQANGTAIDTAGTRFAGATAWAWGNQGTSTATQSGDGSLVFTAQADGNGHGVMQAVGSVWKYRSRYAFTNPTASAGDNCGLFVYNSANTHSVWVGPYANNSSILQIKWNSFTSFNSTTFNAMPHGFTYSQLQEPRWYEIRSDGTTITWALSASGAEGSFIDITTEAIATFLSAVTHVGMATSTNSSPASFVTCDLFRRYV